MTPNPTVKPMEALERFERMMLEFESLVIDRTNAENDAFEVEVSDDGRATSSREYLNLRDKTGAKLQEIRAHVAALSVQQEAGEALAHERPIGYAHYAPRGGKPFLDHERRPDLVNSGWIEIPLVPRRATLIIHSQQVVSPPLVQNDK